MTWKWNSATNSYEMLCQRCRGSGVEQLLTYQSGCDCMAHYTDIEHPANGHNDFTVHSLCRCDTCGLVWMRWWEVTDDSLDVPGPVLIGKEVPDREWRMER